MRKRITVIGDLMIDVDHIVSEETQREHRACLKINSSRKRLGAAGAVAQMVAAMGAAIGVDVTLISVAAIDDQTWIRRQFVGLTFIARTEELTTRRERFYRPDWTVAGPRLDFDCVNKIEKSDRLLMSGRAIGSAADAYIVCDHAKGVIDATIMDQLRTTGRPIYVDPHPQSEWETFHDVEALVMNREEALAATAANPVPKNIISKMDADGVWWYREGWQLMMPQPGPGETNSHVLHFPSMATDVVDTLGAGDQFIATLAVARLKGETMETAIMLANTAAGIQCGRRGIVPIRWGELEAAKTKW